MSKRAGNEWQWLREEILAQFGTQAEFARAGGFSTQQVGRWVNGQRPVRAHRDAICALLPGTKPEDFWP